MSGRDCRGNRRCVSRCMCRSNRRRVSRCICRCDCWCMCRRGCWSMCWCDCRCMSGCNRRRIGGYGCRCICGGWHDPLHSHIRICLCSSSSGQGITESDMEGISSWAADVVVYTCREHGSAGLLVGPDVLTREPHSRIDASDDSVDLGSSTFLTVFGGPVPRRPRSLAGGSYID